MMPSKARRKILFWVIKYSLTTCPPTNYLFNRNLAEKNYFKNTPAVTPQLLSLACCKYTEYIDINAANKNVFETIFLYYWIFFMQQRQIHG